MIAIGLLISGVCFLFGLLTFVAAANTPIVPKSTGFVLATCIFGVIGGLIFALVGAVMAAF